MKRGRRSQETQFKMLILDIVKTAETPLTIEVLRKLISNRTGKNCSWNTVRKYLNQLVEEHKIVRTELPHSHDPLKRTGLTVYSSERI